MKKKRVAVDIITAFTIAVTGISVSSCTTSTPDKAEAAKLEEAARPEVGLPLRAAKKLHRAKQYDKAREMVEVAASAVDDHTPFEQYLLAHIGGSIATASENYDTALSLYREVLTYDYISVAERVEILHAMGKMAYKIESYSDAVDLIRRYRRHGGKDEETLSLLPQAMYMTGRHQEAVQELMNQIEEIERNHGRPATLQRQILDNLSLHLNEMDQRLVTLRTSIADDPSRDAWDELLAIMTWTKDVPSRLKLHFFRLRQWTDTLGAADRSQAINLALRYALPAEAQRLLEEGFRTGAFDTENDEYRQLKEIVTRVADRDSQFMKRSRRPAARARNGKAMVDNGFNLVVYGDHDEGLALMRDGIAKGGHEHPSEAKLLYGYACLLAGDTNAAEEVFSGIGGNGIPAQLARLWVLALKNERLSSSS